MRTNALVVLILVALTCVSAASADVPPTATLTLIPDRNLPALPVAFLIRFTNPSDHVQTIADDATMTIRTATETIESTLFGSPYIKLPSEQMDTCGDGPLYCLHLPANGKREVYIDFSTLLGMNDFLLDEHLSSPGVYDLQLTFRIILGYKNIISIPTNTARLTIEQPSGVDLDAWNFLRTLGQGKWTMTHWAMAKPALAPEMRRRFPTSRYATWMAAMGPNVDIDTQVQLIDQALATNPPASLRDEFLAGKGTALAGWAYHEARSERNLERAILLTERAREAYTELERVAISDYLRQYATTEKAKLMTPAIAERVVLEHDDPPAPEKLVPRVECVTRGEKNAFTAVFAYSNPNQVRKYVPIGSLNQVTPAPRDQGQPRAFRPGGPWTAFKASSPGGNLIWHLDGNTATATADFPVQCGAAAAPASTLPGPLCPLR